jgi:methionyl-tRNA synthetase
MNRKTYLTTTIPYVNAKPHVGFALELAQADAIARYRRLLGEEVQFQTGTDDNAFSNVLSARAAGVPVEEFVAGNSRHFSELCADLSISADRFVRTAEPSHHKAVQVFLSHLDPADLYRATYRGFYCPRCEDFYLERELDGLLCPEHQKEVDEVEESNFFFRLSRYEEEIHDIIASRRLRILPETREAEVLNFIERGLRDFSVSRDAARSGGWGVPFPGDADQVVYVWIDALINYISGLGYPSSDLTSGTWNPDVEKIHVIGKNVWKFHAVYWPALLLSAGLDLPDAVLVHGFLTNDGKKISKSDGTAINPSEYIRRFGAEAVRFYLLRYVRPFEDTDFSASHLKRVYLADLANNLGNLLTRLTALSETAGVQGITNSALPPAPEGFHQALSRFRFDLALGSLFTEVSQINRDLANRRPWETLKAGRVNEANEDLKGWVLRFDAVAYWLSPFLPRTSSAIRDTLRADRIQKSTSLFPRLV